MFNDIERQTLIKASSGLHAETFHSLDIEEQEKQAGMNSTALVLIGLAIGGGLLLSGKKKGKKRK